MRLIENGSLCTMSAICGFLLLNCERDEPWPVVLLLAAAMILFIPFVRNRLKAFWPVSVASSCLLIAFMVRAAHDQRAQPSSFDSAVEYRDSRDEGANSSGIITPWKKSIESDNEAGGVDKPIIDVGVAGESHSRIIVDDRRLELECWAKKYIGEAVNACRPLIERLSKSRFEWIDGSLDHTFSKYRWNDRENGVITFIGDKSRSQTVLGAWQFEIYTCDYDPVSKVVVRVNLTPGGLPFRQSGLAP